MRGGRQATQHPRLGQHEGASADRHQGTLTGWILLLQFGKGLDDGEWLVPGLQQLLSAATRDDEDVDLGETLHGLFVGDMGTEGSTFHGGHVLRRGSEDDTECFGFCFATISDCVSSDIQLLERHTWIALVMLSRAEDLQWTNKVHSIHAFMHGNEDLDWLMMAVLLDYCTHCTGTVVELDEV